MILSGRQVDVFRYAVVDGIPTLADSELATFYVNMKYQEQVFYNLTHIERLDFNAPRFFKQTKLWVAKVDGEIVVGVWLYPFSRLNRTGFFNFGQTGKLPVTAAFKVGFFILEKVFSWECFDLLYGETSVTNLRALHTARLFGFKEIGIAPLAHYHADEGKSVDSMWTFLTLEGLEKSPVSRWRDALDNFSMEV